ncbi:MAG: translesion DNA synthesis-associated protein ImuA [Pseudomonadota bacterium]
MNLSELIQGAKIWRAGEVAPKNGLATGFQALDEALPNGGWPHGLTEILVPEFGVGAMRLIVPALAQLSHNNAWIIWVKPPQMPYAPGLETAGVDLQHSLIVDLPEEKNDSSEALWVFEQALRFGDCGAALFWHDDISALSLRRLQLAAEVGHTWGVIFRGVQYAEHASSANLRIKIQKEDCSRAQLEIIKARGGRWPRQCQVEF